jgi:hypothetical protein
VRLTKPLLCTLDVRHGPYPSIYWFCATILKASLFCPLNQEPAGG